MSYQNENQAKTSFDGVYSSPTPHAYFAEMRRCGYEIGQQASPYCIDAANWIGERLGSGKPLQMLDIGCSYGIGALFVKHHRSFNEVAGFFDNRVPRVYRPACRLMREWLGRAERPSRWVGMDASEPAVHFARDVGLLDHGITRNLEERDAELSDEDRAWLRGCNMFMSTGAIGYVTERSLNRILEHLGKDVPQGAGPIGITTILRMFDIGPIRRSFESHGFQFGRVPNARLPQRRFATDDERRDVLDLLHEKGVETHGWEDRGQLFADLYVIAPAREFPLLMERMTATRGATLPAASRL